MSATEPATRTPSDARAALPRVDRHKPKFPPVRPSKVSRWRAAALIAVQVLIAVHIWHWLATGRSLTPVEPSEAMQTIEAGRINAGFLLFATLLATTLLFGRFFCGWACHVVALQDLSAWLLQKLGLKPRPVRSRLLVLTPWVVAFYMFAWPLVEHWWWPEQKVIPSVSEWQWQLTTDNLWATFPGPIMAIATAVVVGFLIVWWLGAKGFCTYGCPYGALFALADRVAPVRIVVDPDRCEACGHCTTVCTSNVRVHEEVNKHGHVVDPGCMKCLDCVSVCPKEALRVGFARPQPLTTSQQRIRQRADFSWPEELLLALAAVGAFWAFRGAWFGETVPMLMAVGLASITAVLTLVLVRLVFRRDLTFQHTPLKANGARTRAGRWALLGLASWVLFTVHTGIANRLARVADAAIAAAQPAAHAAFYGSRRVAPAELEPAIAAIERAERWHLVGRWPWVEWRALALRGLGRHAEAEQALLAARGDRPGLHMVEANLALASYCMDPQRRNYVEARRLVGLALAASPDHPLALYLQQQLDALPK